MTRVAQPSATPPGVDLLGPVFVSYRVSDGSAHALKLSWALRTTGVPVWHDETDLPPGDTTRRLEEALAAGLSGAVLVVTPEIRKSSVVREVELPALLNLERTSEFTLAIASVIESPSQRSELDFEAPDRLLEQPAGTLKRLRQYRVLSDADTAVLAHQMALQRMAMHARLQRDPLVIDLQTRAAPRAAAADAGLVVRTRPPEAGHRAPPRDIWA
ncbi:MAG: toll/interleukin-1 receptor domain-containing protein, partial [Acidimicrobiales bacterium]